MRLIKAPHAYDFDNFTVFLAGSIEMGNAPRWQDEAAALFSDTDWTVLNPRRDDWDNSWKQEANDPQFREQVEWELHGITGADHVIVYFAPETKSPITLLELGIIAGGSSNASFASVVCKEGFWRKGNVDIVCQKAGIRQFPTLGEACEDLIARQARRAGSLVGGEGRL